MLALILFLLGLLAEIQPVVTQPTLAQRAIAGTFAVLFSALWLIIQMQPAQRSLHIGTTKRKTPEGFGLPNFDWIVILDWWPAATNWIVALNEEFCSADRSELERLWGRLFVDAVITETLLVEKAMVSVDFRSMYTNHPHVVKDVAPAAVLTTTGVELVPFSLDFLVEASPVLA